MGSEGDGGHYCRGRHGGDLVNLHTGTVRLEKLGQGRGMTREGGCWEVSVAQAFTEEGVGAGGEGY